MTAFMLSAPGRPLSRLASIGGSFASSCSHMGSLASTALSSRRASPSVFRPAPSSRLRPPTSPSSSPSPSLSAGFSSLSPASVPPARNSSSESSTCSATSASADSVPSSSSPPSFPLGIKQTLPRTLIKLARPFPSSSSLSSPASVPPTSPSPPSSAASGPSELVVYERQNGSRWVYKHQLSLYLSHAVGLGYFRALFEDSSAAPASVFDLLCDFVRPSARPTIAENEGEESQDERQERKEGAGTPGEQRVTAQDLSDFMKNCVASRYRDVDVLDVVADVLGSLVIGSADAPLLVDIASSCTELSLLRPKLFTAIASRLLVLPLSVSEPSPPVSAPLSPNQAIRLIEAFSRQHIRHPDVLPRLLSSLSPSLSSLSPRLASRLFYALAGLGKTAAPAETLQVLLSRIGSGLKGTDGTSCEGNARDVEETGTQGQRPQMTLPDLAKAAHALLLLEMEVEQKPFLESLVTAMAPEIFERPVDFWSRTAAASLHKRLLLLRTALRHLHRDTIYNSLPPIVRQAFRRLHRIEIASPPRSPTYFVTRMSALLTRLRIAHFCYATRGPLVFDVLERDRPIVWQCNTVDRFYVNSAEKTTAVKLQERITQAMGLRVVNCEYWQWMKMKRKRTRLEYIRMQRYYTLKDRRQHDPDFEGWTLPLVHHMHRRNRLHYDYYFPNYTPLSRVEY